jgi:hypothetical protein
VPARGAILLDARFENTEFGERTFLRVGESQTVALATIVELGISFVHPGRDASLLQSEAQSKPAKPTTGNGHPQPVVNPGSLGCRLCLVLPSNTRARARRVLGRFAGMDRVGGTSSSHLQRGAGTTAAHTTVHERSREL